MYKNYGDKHFLEHGVLVDTEHSDTCFPMLLCRPYDDEQDLYAFGDVEVDIEDSWIDRTAVMAYIGMSKDTFDPVQFAIGCTEYYSWDNFGAGGSYSYDWRMVDSAVIYDVLRHRLIASDNLDMEWLEDNKSEIMDIMKSPQAVLVFDVDGVLAAFEYGSHNHNVCLDSEWEEYIKTHNVYATARPLKTIQKFLESYGTEERTFVCTRDYDEGKQQKIEFVTKNYAIPKEHIYAVLDNKEKLAVMNHIHHKYFPNLDPKYMVMVDDTAEVLTNIQEHSEYSTAHISSFLQ